MGIEKEHTRNNLLVERYQDGDERALKRLINRFHPKLVRTIRYYTGDRAPVDDIAQECWYDIIEKLPEVKLKIGFDAWALTIVRRRAIDWIRERQRSRDRDREIQAEARSESEAGEAEDKEEKLEKIRIGIRRLSPTRRVVLKMFYLENLSLKEISDVLEVSEGTVKSRLFYARENLKELIT